MAKLSKAMIEVLDQITADIQLAKENDYPEWLMVKLPNCDWREERFEHITDAELKQRLIAEAKARWEKRVAEKYLYEYWEMGRDSIALTNCNSGTIRAIEKRGYIEIMKDTANQSGGVDRVRLVKQGGE